MVIEAHYAHSLFIRQEDEMNRFTTDNTEGYTAIDLAKLNAEFDRRVAKEGATDESHLDHIAERVLADFDTAGL